MAITDDDGLTLYSKNGLAENGTRTDATLASPLAPTQTPALPNPALNVTFTSSGTEGAARAITAYFWVEV